MVKFKEMIGKYHWPKLMEKKTDQKKKLDNCTAFGKLMLSFKFPQT